MSNFKKGIIDISGFRFTKNNSDQDVSAIFKKYFPCRIIKSQSKTKIALKPPFPKIEGILNCNLYEIYDDKAQGLRRLSIYLPQDRTNRQQGESLETYLNRRSETFTTLFMKETDYVDHATNSNEFPEHQHRTFYFDWGCVKIITDYDQIGRQIVDRSLIVYIEYHQ